MKSSPKTTKTTPNHLLPVVIVASVIGVIALGLVATAYAYTDYYQGSIYPGVFIGERNVGGQNPEIAFELMTQDYDRFQEQGIDFTYQNTVVTITPSIVSPTDPDLHYQLMTWEPRYSIAESYQIGREGNFLQQLFIPLYLRISPIVIKPGIEIDEKKLREVLEQNFSEFETKPTTPTITWSYPKPSVEAGQNGMVFDYQGILAQTKQQMRAFDSSPISLQLSPVQPEVTLADISTDHYILLNELTTRRPTLSWHIQDKTWYYTFVEYQNHLEWYKTNTNTRLTLSDEWITQQLEKVKVLIDRPAQDARFEVVDGKVEEFLDSKDGLVLSIPDSVKHIQKTFSDAVYNTELVLQVDRAQIQTHDVNDLGITELIGVGESDYSGSPPNREHNISIGAESLNGLLIKPGEEFSLVDALVPIDATTGYLPELVIKGDKTIPEYGGGLCQIGTTAFRAALATGLPITERRNHSYRVRYYEPAGTDATIYDPAPDFKFLNDTPGHILIQTRMDAGKMIFEFWGTTDGRVATTTQPKIYNITAPPPTKYVLTEDLEPGVTKCTESAHNGADAEFTYTVTRPGGETTERTFFSHYRPWQAVCLVGQSGDEEQDQALLQELQGGTEL